MLTQIIALIERQAARLLGKGWGGATLEQELQAAVSLLPSKKPNLCIDVGGNKGLYTKQILHASHNCDVVIFEPAYSNFKHLNQLFSDSPTVKIEQLALSDTNTEATLYSDRDGSGLASLTKRRLDHFGIIFEHTETTKTIRFENYWKSKLNSQQIDICKIDIEGHELSALAGFGEAIKNISVIQFEFGGANIDTRTFFQDLWYFFDDHQFDLYRISPLGLLKVQKYKEADEHFKTTNYLARRR